VPAAPAIARWLQREVPLPILVGPDSESEQWMADVAGRIGAPWVVKTKERRGDREVHVRLPPGADHTGRRAGHAASRRHRARFVSCDTVPHPSNGISIAQVLADDSAAFLR
jgi:hypothetical protein